VKAKRPTAEAALDSAQKLLPVRQAQAGRDFSRRQPIMTRL